MKKEPILLNQKKLASALGVSPPWVRAMHRCGFPMPGGRSTVNEALQWLKKNPDFRMRKVLKGPMPVRSNLPA